MKCDNKKKMHAPSPFLHHISLFSKIWQYIFIPNHDVSLFNTQWWYCTFQVNICDNDKLYCLETNVCVLLLRSSSHMNIVYSLNFPRKLTLYNYLITISNLQERNVKNKQNSTSSTFFPLSTLQIQFQSFSLCDILCDQDQMQLSSIYQILKNIHNYKWEERKTGRK